MHYDCKVGYKKTLGALAPGATDNFISPQLAHNAGLSIQKHYTNAQFGDGSVVVSHGTATAVCGIGFNASEQTLYVLDLPEDSLLVLGTSWLHEDNPKID